MSDAIMKQGESRDAMLGRVRAALGHGGATPTPPPPPAIDETIARLASRDDDLVTMFAERAAKVGMSVRRCDRDSQWDTFAGVLRELEANSAVVSAEKFDGVFEFTPALESLNVELIDWRARPGFEAQYEVDVGITDVVAGLAETGTLVIASGSDRSRGLSLVPPNHVALVRGSDLLPDMIDYWATKRGSAPIDLPSSQVLITGPSKTADIEGQLITGVHGPGRVEILLVTDL